MNKTESISLGVYAVINLDFIINFITRAGYALQGVSWISCDPDRIVQFTLMVHFFNSFLYHWYIPSRPLNFTCKFTSYSLPLTQIWHRKHCFWIKYLKLNFRRNCTFWCLPKTKFVFLVIRLCARLLSKQLKIVQ